MHKRRYGDDALGELCEKILTGITRTLILNASVVGEGVVCTTRAFYADSVRQCLANLLTPPELTLISLKFI